MPSTVYRDRDPHWDELLKQLLDDGIIDSRQPFDKDFTKTGRNKADVRPGVRLERVWGIEEATTLDEQDALVDQIKQAFAEALTCFGTTPKAV